ncbi:Protein of uncharacterised function (DUF2988) [Vibrio cholerae]|nr:Protein of uncharacterised function (DUF2988) [Vibrio cholerae]
MMLPFVNQICRVEYPTTLKLRDLWVFSDFEIAEISTLSTKSASGKTQKPNCAT